MPPFVVSEVPLMCRKPLADFEPVKIKQGIVGSGVRRIPPRPGRARKFLEIRERYKRSAFEEAFVERIWEICRADYVPRRLMDR